MMKIKDMANFVFQITYIWIFWIIVHWVTAQLYQHFCAHRSFVGFFTMVFLTPAPHCKALWWTMGVSRDNIIQMWVVLGTWCMSRLTTRLTTATNHQDEDGEHHQDEDGGDDDGENHKDDENID